MVQHTKSIVVLEITKRHKILQAKFFDFVTIFVLTLIVTKETKNGGMGDGMKLNWMELSANTAYNALADTPPEFATSLALTNNEALLQAFSAKQQWGSQILTLAA